MLSKVPKSVAIIRDQYIHWLRHGHVETQTPATIHSGELHLHHILAYYWSQSIHDTHVIRMNRGQNWLQNHSYNWQRIDNLFSPSILKLQVYYNNKMKDGDEFTVFATSSICMALNLNTIWDVMQGRIYYCICFTWNHFGLFIFPIFQKNSLFFVLIYNLTLSLTVTRKRVVLFFASILLEIWRQ